MCWLWAVVVWGERRRRRRRWRLGHRLQLLRSGKMGDGPPPTPALMHAVLPSSPWDACGLRRTSVCRAVHGQRWRRPPDPMPARRLALLANRQGGGVVGNSVGGREAHVLLCVSCRAPAHHHHHRHHQHHEHRHHCHHRHALSRPSPRPFPPHHSLSTLPSVRRWISWLTRTSPPLRPNDASWLPRHFRSPHGSHRSHRASSALIRTVPPPARSRHHPRRSFVTLKRRWAASLGPAGPTATIFLGYCAEVPCPLELP